MLFNATVEQLQLTAQGRLARFGQCLHKVVDHGAQAPRDLKVLSSVEAKFAESELKKILPVRGRKNHPQLSGIVRYLFFA